MRFRIENYVAVIFLQPGPHFYLYYFNSRQRSHKLYISMAFGRNYSVGIDIGTNQVKVIIAEFPEKERESAGAVASGNHSGVHTPATGGATKRSNSPRILGAGIAEMRGMRHGYITHPPEAAKSIRAAVDQASKSSGIVIKKAFVSVGGIGLGAIIATGLVNTTKADSEITDLDVRRAIEESEKELPHVYIQNRKIVHTIPLEYRIDGKKVLGKPQGLKGLRLECRVLYITSQAHHLSEILAALEEADIEALDIIASPMASSLVSLNKTQKIAGCVLANIGAQTTSIIVFEENTPKSLEVFPFGSNDVTNDIALGLKVSLEQAEQIKMGNDRGITYSKKKLDEIIIARLSDIFDLIDDHLRRMDRSRMLPAGIILTGGGSGIPDIEELARMALHLPSSRAHLPLEGNLKAISKDYEWSVAYGLAVLGLGSDDNPAIDFGTGMGGEFLKRTGKSFWTWLKRFLP